jgi:hypothetical protein
VVEEGVRVRSGRSAAGGLTRQWMCASPLKTATPLPLQQPVPSKSNQNRHDTLGFVTTGTHKPAFTISHATPQTSYWTSGQAVLR